MEFMLAMDKISWQKVDISELFLFSLSRLQRTETLTVTHSIGLHCNSSKGEIE